MVATHKYEWEKNVTLTTLCPYCFIFNSLQISLITSSYNKPKISKQSIIVYRLIHVVFLQEAFGTGIIQLFNAIMRLIIDWHKFKKNIICTLELFLPLTGGDLFVKINRFEKILPNRHQLTSLSDWDSGTYSVVKWCKN